MESTSGTGIDTGSALRAATFTEAVEAITAGLESEAFVDVHVKHHMAVTSQGMTASSATICCREGAQDGPIVEVCTVLSFCGDGIHTGPMESAPVMVVRWTGDDACRDTEENPGEREALTYAELRMRSQGATMAAGPAMNQVAHSALRHMNSAHLSLKVLSQAMPRSRMATDGNR